ncbi:hypothetical protein JAAARDRAFT_53883 [Jaapia argillacea MUCL 33604]|uniref:Uncharacterized protein n=1 Tax=Jaapia argillacea MUCL 33604 TaxID=933084 RepID=A0A067Q9G7_9AGAM|nr:hypothetical protein JAAARDRAFT_53883 [Jaapia argillacea MUCL 33604]
MPECRIQLPPLALHRLSGKMYILKKSFVENDTCPPERPACDPGADVPQLGPPKPIPGGNQGSPMNTTSIPPHPPSVGKFAGVIILAAAVFLALILYLAFGKWPRRVTRRWRKAKHRKPVGKTGERRMKSRGVQTTPVECGAPGTPGSLTDTVVDEEKQGIPPLAEKRLGPIPIEALEDGATQMGKGVHEKREVSVSAEGHGSGGDNVETSRSWELDLEDSQIIYY